MRNRRRCSGTTLLEILIAVALLAMCAATILDSVLVADNQGAYALRRSIVISALQDEIETARGSAAAGTLAPGTNTTGLTFPGFQGPVAITWSITLMPTSRVLFNVTATATWTEESSPTTTGPATSTFTDNATLTTLVEQ